MVLSLLCGPRTFLWLEGESGLLKDFEAFSANSKMVVVYATDGKDTDIVKEDFDFDQNPRVGKMAAWN